MKRAHFFLLLLMTGRILLSQNLVLNPGIEYWNRTDKPVSWTNAQGCLKDSVYIFSGDYSCRQEATTISRDLGQKFIVKPSTPYRFSFFFKTGAETTGNGSRVWCSWLDESKVEIDDPVIHSGFMNSENWLKYEVAVTSPEEAGYFYILVRTLPNSVTYWDEFIFEEDIASGNNETKSPGINVYPNPASDYLTIRNIHNLQQIDIHSITGIILWSGKYNGENEVTIPVFKLTDGIYLLKVSTENGIYFRKFIKKSE